MIVLDKLEAALLSHFGGGERPIHIVTEPSNAMARREIRILAIDQRLNPIGGSTEHSVMRYELMLDCLVSVRLSGGNSNKLLSGQAVFHSVALAEFLQERLVVLSDIDEVLPDMRQHIDEGWALQVVGDAELTNAKRLKSGFSGAQSSDDIEQKKDDLYTWREDWKISLAMTVHREFPNQYLKQMIFINSDDNELTVPPTQGEPK